MQTKEKTTNYMLKIPLTLEELARFNRYVSWGGLLKGQLIRRLLLEHMDEKGAK